MATVSQQIQNADAAICRNIALLSDRALLSQNVLSQLRNLVEGVAVRLHSGAPDSEFVYAAIEPALAFVKRKAKLNFLGSSTSYFSLSLLTTHSTETPPSA